MRHLSWSQGRCLGGRAALVVQTLPRLAWASRRSAASLSPAPSALPDIIPLALPVRPRLTTGCGRRGRRESPPSRYTGIHNHAHIGSHQPPPHAPQQSASLRLGAGRLRARNRKLRRPRLARTPHGPLASVLRISRPVGAAVRRLADPPPVYRPRELHAYDEYRILLSVKSY